MLATPNPGAAPVGAAGGGAAAVAGGLRSPILDVGTTLRSDVTDTCYTIVEPLKEGSFGRVYVAMDDRGGRHAIKVLHDQVERDDDGWRYEVANMERVRGLCHPNLPVIRDAFIDIDGATRLRCIVMGLIEGETLLDRMSRR